MLSLILSGEPDHAAPKFTRSRPPSAVRVERFNFSDALDDSRKHRESSFDSKIVAEPLHSFDTQFGALLETKLGGRIAMRHSAARR